MQSHFPPFWWWQLFESMYKIWDEHSPLSLQSLIIYIFLEKIYPLPYISLSPPLDTERMRMTTRCGNKTFPLQFPMTAHLPHRHKGIPHLHCCMMFSLNLGTFRHLSVIVLMPWIHELSCDCFGYLDLVILWLPTFWCCQRGRKTYVR